MSLFIGKFCNFGVAMDKRLTLHERFGIVALLLALMMTVLDVTLVNMALPVISSQFGVSASESVWVVTVYQLVITVLLLPLSSVGDLHSYKKTFIAGVIIFSISSLLCSVSDSFIQIVLSRGVQGIGAACVMSVNIALTRLIYPKKIIGRGLALNAMVIAVTTAVGPTLAGAILSVASWHWLFIINIPLGCVVLCLSVKYLPENRKDGDRVKFDYLGAIQNIFVFGMIFLALTTLTGRDHIYYALIMLCVGITAGCLYVRRERRIKSPMLPVDLLGIRLYSLSIFTSICSFIAQNLVLISLPFLFLKCFGFSEISAGILLTPWPIATLIVSPIAARFVERYNPGVIAAIGMAVFSIGVLSLIFYQPEITSKISVAFRLAVCGIGYGLYQTPNNVVMVLATPVNRAGGAGGLQSTARLVGQTFGAIFVAIIFAINLDMMDATRICMYCGAAVALLAGGLSVNRARHIKK